MFQRHGIYLMPCMNKEIKNGMITNFATHAGKTKKPLSLNWCQPHGN